jgi:hypothetical protein
MQRRSQQDRRIDRLTAERFDLAILAARAFDLRAGQSYLKLSGIGPSLVERFATRFPNGLRMTASSRTERRGRA